MHFRERYYPDLTVRAYLNHAAVAPMSRRIREAFSHNMQLYAAEGASGWLPALESKERARVGIAALIGAHPSEIGLVNNTSMGLSMVAQEFPWSPGDGIALVRGEFPGNVVPWLAAARAHDLRVHWLNFEDLAEGSHALDAVMAQRPKLLAVSWVQFQNGKLLPLERLADLRARYGFQICLDAIQALGALRLTHLDQLDYIVAGGHKWLLGSEGTGFIRIHPERMGALRPRLVSWLSQEEPVGFLFQGGGRIDYEKACRQQANRIELASTCNWLYAAMAESCEMLLEVGPELVEQRVLALADRARAGLRELGAKIPAEARAGIASFALKDQELRQTAKALQAESIQIATPDGHLRIAPHFYNEPEEVDFCLQALGRCQEQGLFRLV